ncbi:TetR family transcriptional regulator [Frondihabitans sp. PhB188]|uniref:TetR/AcrR family transcriptional regulator n=1 Tax=Frondihabitans sp. PhB188 TaxID=2485200 RepID=UPI000F4A3A5A|nr:TetR/AcrR family transcriptional regulator C-terminal domain-containing protein [Frondihabitans sp. PhB188]ROQ39690.1 TetR family transcriptional regulator [Frondihabitans sp. PhB188]
MTSSVLTETRKAIDDAARDIALSTGLSTITLRRLCAVTGLTPGVVAAEEPSMHALVARTFSDVARADFVGITTAMAAEATPLSALRVLVSAVLVTDDSLDKTIWADAWSVGRHSEFVATALRERLHEWQDTLVALLIAGTASGDFSVTNPGLAARQFFALIDSTTVYGLVGYLDEHERVELFTRSLEVSIGLAAGTLAP